jgi:HlyD family secretion protein
MKAYAPEPEIGRIKIGDEARVYVDAFPGQPFSATVREIASESEFTPKEVQTREERVKQVIAVKLYLDANPEHRLVPGMPADAFIRWQPGAAWMDASR